MLSERLGWTHTRLGAAAGISSGPGGSSVLWDVSQRRAAEG